eukprot:1395625-Rhodomonas_salina.1
MLVQLDRLIHGAGCVLLSTEARFVIRHRGCPCNAQAPRHPERHTPQDGTSCTQPLGTIHAHEAAERCVLDAAATRHRCPLKAELASSAHSEAALAASSLSPAAITIEPNSQHTPFAYASSISGRSWGPQADMARRKKGATPRCKEKGEERQTGGEKNMTRKQWKECGKRK